MSILFVFPLQLMSFSLLPLNMQPPILSAWTPIRQSARLDRFCLASNYLRSKTVNFSHVKSIAGAISYPCKRSDPILKVQALIYSPVIGVDPTAASRAHPSCPQLQESSIVSPASLQYWLQYLLPFSARQSQAG